MTFTDYLIDITLIGLVVLQVRGRRLTTRALLLPLGLVAYVAASYLHGVPTAGNDLVLVGGCAAIGATLGLLAGLFTSVTTDGQGTVFAKAGLAAAALWIVGTGGRLAFQVYASHGGAPALGRFSAAHSITSAEAWTAALILMALSEVVLRTGVLAWRTMELRRQGQTGLGITDPAPQARRPVLASARSMIETGERSY
jgi:hypothetical protein